MDPVRMRDNIICKHCGVPCAGHDKKVYMASGLQIGGYSTITINGKPFPGITRVRLTKEQLEEVRGSEKEFDNG